MPKTKFTNIALPDVGKVVSYVKSICQKPCVIKLYGDLGAGKTLLAKHLVASLTGKDADDVISPTFNLVQVYKGGGMEVWHYDLYRLNHPSELLELGMDEALDNIVIVEWPQIADNYLPTDAICINVDFASDSNTRNYTINA